MLKDLKLFTNRLSNGLLFFSVCVHHVRFKIDNFRIKKIVFYSPLNKVDFMFEKIYQKADFIKSGIIPGAIIIDSACYSIIIS